MRIVFFLVVFFVLLSPLSAEACTVFLTEELSKENIEGADFIFEGAAVSSEPSEELKEELEKSSNWYPRMRAIIEVVHSYKGELEGEVEVFYRPGENSCGNDVHIGLNEIFAANKMYEKLVLRGYAGSAMKKEHLIRSGEENSIEEN